jgi:drug/metabolite transporter (DMT)-like permease
MFYYVLKRVEVSRVALVTLITPVIALFIGQGVNHESIDPMVWVGTAFILFGMSLYQWGEQFFRSERELS